MTYTKPWTLESDPGQDPWIEWLNTHALSGLEYNLIFWEDRLVVEFYDLDRSQEFAQEQGL